MSALIPLHETSVNHTTVPTANARELHTYLEVKTVFHDWIKRRIETYGFSQDIDYSVLISEHGPLKTIEYFVTLDMAKQLAMVERTDKGREARRYFIACEHAAQAHIPTQAAQPPTLPDPASQLALCQATYAFLEELGCATDRDRLAIADYAAMNHKRRGCTGAKTPLGPLRLLQDRHAGTMFAISCRPPCTMGVK